MAQLPNAFDTRTAPPPREDFEILPAGEYLALITDSDMKKTKNGNGEYLELTFTVLDGPAKGRKAWSRLNLVNQSAKAAEIAQRDLNAICAAIGHIGSVPDSVVLHNKPLVIRVTVEAADASKGRTNDQNEIKAYKAVEGAVGSAAAAIATPAPAATAPWGRAA